MKNERVEWVFESSKHKTPETEKGRIMNNEKPTRDPTEVKPVTLDDTQHVAFLKLAGWKVTPWIEFDEQNPNQDPNSKRVEFQIEGDPDKIERDMQKFYANALIPIQDFCRCLKEVKSAMYNLRRLKAVEYRSIKP